MQLQGADEGQQEHLVVDELCKELQSFLYVLLSISLYLQGAQDNTSEDSFLASYPRFSEDLLVMAYGMGPSSWGYNHTHFLLMKEWLLFGGYSLP